MFEIINAGRWSIQFGMRSVLGRSSNYDGHFGASSFDRSRTKLGRAK